MAIDVTLLCLAMLLEGICGPNWSVAFTVSERKILKQAIRRARFFYYLLPNQQAHLCRVLGRAWWRLEKKQRAIRLFEKAVQLAEKKGMKYQQAKSLLDLSAVKEHGRDANRAEAIRLLKEMKSVIPRAERWLLGDQYDESIVAPEFDLAAWEREHGPITPYILQGDNA
jgi:tetratricopeptide (TPR) repeat protein